MARREKNQNEAGASLFSFGNGSAEVPGQNDSRSGAANGRGLIGQEDKQDNPSASMSLFSKGKSNDPLGPEYGYNRARIRRKNEVSVYNEQMDARYAMDRRKRSILLLVVALIVLLPLSVIAPTGWLTLNGLSHGIAGWLDILQSNLRAFGNWVSGVPDGNGISILFYQTLVVAMIGAALALNGAVYQGAMKNALASPSTLGVMSGGTLGTIVYMLVFVAPETGDMLESGVEMTQASEMIEHLDQLDTFSYILETQGRALCSIVGCFVVVSLVLLIAYIAGRGKVSKSALIIAGQVFAAVISGAIGVVRTYLIAYGTDEQVEAIRATVGGSVNYIARPIDVALIAVPLAIGFFIVMRLRFKMNLLAFGDDEARSLGISVNWTRNAVMIVCTVMTAVVVSFCGNVGFVGFLVPHIARKMVGPDLRYLIPASALVGSIYLLLAHHLMSLGDILSSSLGSFTSLVGVVFFIVAIVRQRRAGNVDWI